MLKLLINSLAKEFYQQHAGYFIIGFYVLFGVVEPSQLIGYHKALLLAAVSSPMGLLVVFTAWILYGIKVHFFIKQRLNGTTYNFIKEVGTMSRHRQIKLWLALYGVLLLPILIYVLALVGISVYSHHFTSLIYIIIVFSALTFCLSYLSYRSVTFGFLKRERQQITLFTKLKRPFFSWPLFYLLNEQPLMLLMCKIVSLVFFKSILWMFADVGTDIRVLLVALLASVLCHSTLVFTLLKFEIKCLSFSKSLPISIYKRLGCWLLTSAIILLPEWMFLMIASEYDLYSIANGFLFGLAGLLFLLVVLYVVKLDMDIYLRWLLFFFFISMWSILGHYYLSFSLVLLGSCTLYYLINYDKVDLSTN
ncbi:MAG: hypothetical protein WKF66_09045 [Pedobacter sp.]